MKQQEKKGRELYETVKALVGVVVAVTLVFTFALRVFNVSGGSMRHTLQNGDKLLVVNRPLCGDIGQGDIVILAKKSFRDGEPIVKRVIAAGGQTVDIDFSEGVVYVDGQALSEPYTREPTYQEEGLEFPVTLGENEVFVMGDNRNDSSDSRHSDIGCVDLRNVMGKAVALLIPGETAETELREWSRIGFLD
ncbi:MAG: signal peptidase I [Oscillibacter sp.]|nr:signal peptidase I [Oscillibacter sp.]